MAVAEKLGFSPQHRASIAGSVLVSRGLCSREAAALIRPEDLSDLSEVIEELDDSTMPCVMYPSVIAAMRNLSELLEGRLAAV